VTRPRLPIEPSVVVPRRRGGVRGTGAASGSPTSVTADERFSVSVKPDLAGLPRNHDEALLLEAREVARLLGIGRTKTYQLIARGEVPVLRLGRCVRVPRSALDAWIAFRTSLSVEG